MFKFSGTRPSNLGVKDGKLAACPSSPNCVNSQADDRHHGIGPLAFSGDAVTAMQSSRASSRRYRARKSFRAGPTTLYVEFSTPLMGFVDDVEFYCDGKAIQVAPRPRGSATRISVSIESGSRRSGRPSVTS